MILGVTSPSQSVWTNTVCAANVSALVSDVPSDSILVLPTSAHRMAVRRAWAVARSQHPVPTLLTMPQLHTFLCGITTLLTNDVQAITDAEADLVLDSAIQASGEPFRPFKITASRLIRWKMEGLSADYVQHTFPAEDRPYDLRDLDRLLRVWKAYDALCGTRLLDRGSLAQRVVDTLAIEPPTKTKNVLVVATHGLSRVDRMLLHLLARYQWDVGVMFANHPDVACKSQSDGHWLVAHGWHAAYEGEWNAPAISIHPMQSPRDEVKRILAAVKELWSNNVPLSNMCIALPEGDLYRRLFLEQSNAGVPLSLCAERTLAMMPEATLLHSVCRAFTDGWRLADIERIVNNMALPTTDALHSLPSTAQTLRIVGGMGLQEWVQRTTHHASDGTDVAAGIARLIAIEQALPNQGTSSMFADGLNNLASLLHIQLPTSLLETIGKYSAVTARLTLPPQSLQVHLRQWWQLVSGTKAAAPAHTNTLAVLRANEMRLMEFDYVFAPGMAEGIMPRIATDTLDTTLADINPLEMERERWADIQNAARNGRVICTWPQVLDDSTTLRSQFLLHVNQSPLNLDTLDKSGVVLLDAVEAEAYTATPMQEHGAMQQGIAQTLLEAQAAELFATTMQRPLSPTRLDTVIDCPYQYFASNVLRLDVEQETDESITPRERGELMHAIAQRFFDTVRGCTIAQVGTVADVVNAQVHLTSRSVEEWMPVLVSCYRELRASYPRGYLYDSSEEAMLLDSKGRAGLLRRWLTYEYKQQKDNDFRPVLFEIAFNGHLDLGFTTENVNLRIDRIDAFIEDDTIVAKVIDYKTTGRSVPTSSLVAAGKRTQPLLYTLAAQQWFTTNGLDAVVSDMCYQTFGRSVHVQNEPSTKVILPLKKLEQTAMNNAITSLKGAEAGVNAIRNGRFAVSPREGVCEKCSFKEVCRIESWGSVHI